MVGKAVLRAFLFPGNLTSDVLGARDDDDEP